MMTSVNPIPRDRWTAYFDDFARRFLRDEIPESATVVVRGGRIGERSAVTGARLLGITYDRRGHVLDIALEGRDGLVADHLVLRPVAIWTREAEDGFVEQVTVLREDGLREVVTLERAAEPAGMA